MSKRPKLRAVKPADKPAAVAAAPTPGPVAPPPVLEESAAALATRDEATRVARETACGKAVERVCAEYGCSPVVQAHLVPSERALPNGNKRVVWEVATTLQILANDRR